MPPRIYSDEEVGITSQEPRVYSDDEVGLSTQESTKRAFLEPSINLPDVPRNTVGDAIDVVGKAARNYPTVGPAIEYFSQEAQKYPKVLEAASEGLNQVNRAAESFTSPLNIGTMAIGGLGRVAGRLLGGYFGYEAAKNMATEGAEKAGTASVNGDAAEQVGAYTGMGIQGLIGLLGLAHMGKAGLAKEVPALHEALTKRVETELTPDQLRDMYQRVTSDIGASEADKALITELNLARVSPKQAVQRGATITEESPRFQTPRFNEYLGVNPKSLRNVRLGPEDIDFEPAQGLEQPVPEPVQSPAPLSRGLRLRDVRPEPEPVPEPVVQAPAPTAPAPVPEPVRVPGTVPDASAVADVLRNPIEVGRGGNAIVYDIPNTPFVLRVGNTSNRKITGTFKPVEDIAPGMSLGQSVAEHNGMSILRRQTGIPAGLSNWNRSGTPQADSENSAKYETAIETAAAMPQSAYDQFATELKQLQERGLQFDPSKSNNVLIDPSSGRFNLVDISKGTHKGNLNDMLIVLQGNTFAYQHKGKDLDYARKQIHLKAFSAAIKAGLKTELDSSGKYSAKLAGLDKTPAPVPAPVQPVPETVPVVSETVPAPSSVAQEFTVGKGVPYGNQNWVVEKTKGDKVQIRDSSGRKEWVPAGKLRLAQQLARQPAPPEPIELQDREAPKFDRGDGIYLIGTEFGEDLGEGPFDSRKEAETFVKAEVGVPVTYVEVKNGKPVAPRTVPAPLSPEPAQAPKAKVPAPAPVPAPVAQAQMQKQVSITKRNKGERPAKDVKLDLVTELETALKNLNEQDENRPPHVQIDIPGDGSFKVFNSRKPLEEMLERAKALKTDKGKAPPMPETKIDRTNAGKRDRLGSEVDKVIELYGGEDNAIRTVTRQKEVAKANGDDISRVDDMLVQMWQRKAAVRDTAREEEQRLKNRVSSLQSIVDKGPPPKEVQGTARSRWIRQDKEAVAEINELSTVLKDATQKRETLEREYDALSKETDEIGAAEAQRLAAEQQQPLFSLQGQPSTGLSASTVAQHLAPLMSQSRPGTVQVVQSEGQLPEEVRTRTGIAGVAWNGKVWMVADNLTDLQHAERVLLEEYEHLGFDEDQAFLDGVLARYENNPLRAEIENLYLDGRIAESPQDKALVAKEIMGRIAQDPQSDPTLWQRFLAWFTELLRKLGLRRTVGENEIRAALSRSRANVREGAVQSTEPMFSYTNPKSVEEVQSLEENVIPKYKTLTDALSVEPTRASLSNQSLERFDALPEAVKKLMPLIADRDAMLKAYPDRYNPNDQRPIIDQLMERFNGDPERVLSVMAATLENLEETRALRDTVSDRLNEQIESVRGVLKDIGTLKPDKIEADVAQTKAEDMIEHWNDEQDQRLSRESNEGIKATIQMARKMVADRFNPMLMARVLEATQKLTQPRIQQLAQDIRNQGETVATLKEKYPIFNWISDEAAGFALEVMRLNQNLYDELLTVKEASNPSLQADIKKLDQGVVGDKIDIKKWADEFAQVKSIAIQHAKVLWALRRSLRANLKQLGDLQHAHQFLNETINGPHFQKNWEDSIGLTGAVEMVDDGDGRKTTWANPNDPSSNPEKVTYKSATTVQEEEANQQALIKLGQWYMQYIADGKDQLKRHSFAEALKAVDQKLRDPLNNPRAGNRRTRTMAIIGDPFQLFTVFGRTPPPNYIGRLAGGEHGSRIRREVHVFEEASNIAHNMVAEWLPKIQASAKKASLTHGMSMEQWERQISDKIHESNFAFGERHKDVGDSLDGGLVITQEDMAAVRKQAAFDRALRNKLGNIQGTVAGAEPVLIDRPPERGVENMRAMRTKPFPLPENAVARRLSGDALSLAEKWTAIKAKNPNDTQSLIELIDNPIWKDTFLSYFRTFNDPSFVVKSPIRKTLVEIGREIEIGNAPANFNEWVTRIQEKEARRTPSNVLSKPQVRELVLADLNKVMNLVNDLNSTKDTSETASDIKVINAQNFMNRPRGETLGLKGMYDTSLVSDSDIAHHAAAALLPFGQRMLNAWRSWAESLQEYKGELEREIGKTKTRSQVMEDSERSMQVGDSFYALRELKTLIRDVQIQIKRYDDELNQIAVFEAGSVGPRWLRALTGNIVTGMLQSIGSMINNHASATGKMVLWDRMFNDVSMLAAPAHWAKNEAVQLSNLFKMMGAGIGRALANTKKGQAALAEFKANPDRYKGIMKSMVRGIQWGQKFYDDAQDVGLTNFAPLTDIMRQRIALWPEGGRYVGDNPTELTRRARQLANMIEMTSELGIPLFRAPASWLPQLVDAAANYSARYKTTTSLARLQINILKAFKTRVEAGENPETIVLSPKEYIPTARDPERMFIDLNQWFDENGMRLDLIAREYWKKTHDTTTTTRRNGATVITVVTTKARPNAGEIPLVNPIEKTSLTLSAANELNRATAGNRLQFASPLMRLMNILQGYWQNENAKWSLAMGKAARNAKKFAALHNHLTVLLPIMLTLIAAAVFFSGPLATALIEMWEKRKRNVPDWKTAETPMDWLKVIGYNAGPQLPAIGQFINNMVQADAPGRGMFGGSLNLWPISQIQGLVDLVKQVGQTGELARPLAQWEMRINPNSRMVYNRTDWMAGYAAMQNDLTVQRRLTPSTIELRKQSGAPAQYSPVWGQIQAIKNELGKENPDYAKIDQFRNEGVEKLRAAGKEEPEKSFDRSFLASANKYLSAYGKELTQGEKDQIDKKKTPEERAESDRIDSNVQSYAQRYGDPVPDFVRQPKGTGGGSGPAPSTRTVSVSAGGEGGGGSLGGTRSTGFGSGTGIGRVGGIRRVSSGRSRGARLRGGYGLRKISTGTRTVRAKGFRAPRARGKVRNLGLRSIKV